MAPPRSGVAHEAVRIVLWATCAKAELIGRLQPILGDRLTVVANAGELEAAIGDADALLCGDFVYSARVAQAVRKARDDLVL